MTGQVIQCHRSWCKSKAHATSYFVILDVSPSVFAIPLKQWLQTDTLLIVPDKAPRFADFSTISCQLHMTHLSSKQLVFSTPPLYDAAQPSNIRYDTIEEFNVESKAEYRLQLNLAHVARNQNKQQCPFNSVQVKIHEGKMSIVYTSLKCTISALQFCHIHYAIFIRLAVVAFQNHEITKNSDKI